MTYSITVPAPNVVSARLGIGGPLVLDKRIPMPRAECFTRCTSRLQFASSAHFAGFENVRYCRVELQALRRTKPPEQKAYLERTSLFPFRGKQGGACPSNPFMQIGCR